MSDSGRPMHWCSRHGKDEPCPDCEPTPTPSPESLAREATHAISDHLERVNLNPYRCDLDGVVEPIILATLTAALAERERPLSQTELIARIGSDTLKLEAMVGGPLPQRLTVMLAERSRCLTCSYCQLPLPSSRSKAGASGGLICQDETTCTAESANEGFCKLQEELAEERRQKAELAACLRKNTSNLIHLRDNHLSHAAAVVQVLQLRIEAAAELLADKPTT